VFTLLPFSHARRHRSTQNDMINYRVGNDFAGKLAETLKNIEVSQTGAGPAEALRAVNQLLGEPEDQRRILYIISDFRAKEWNDPADLKKMLQEWQAVENEKVRLENYHSDVCGCTRYVDVGISAALTPYGCAGSKG